MNKQVEMALVPVKTADINGLEMGILPDGTPYLTGRGLARACGVAPGMILTLDQEWSRDSLQPQHQKIANLLDGHGYTGDTLYFKARHDGVEVNCHPDAVCMAILEYYAFEATTTAAPVAQRTIRNLLRGGLRAYIYTVLKYDPLAREQLSWKNFQDRLLLNQLPDGFFSVFAESAFLVVPAIKNGLHVDEHVVPDISLGQVWGRHWEDSLLDQKFGLRRRHPHRYPDSYPQSAANDSIEPWIYPLASVSEFRLWMQNIYLPEKFPSYLQRKVKSGALLHEHRSKILGAFGVPAGQVLPTPARTKKLPGTPAKAPKKKKKKDR